MYVGAETVTGDGTGAGVIVMAVLALIVVAGMFDPLPTKRSPWGDFYGDCERAAKQREKKRLQAMLERLEAAND
jgi:hypothetical protein